MPGPAPKNPEDRVRRNVDPITDANGWQEIDGSLNEDEPPKIPAWSSQNPIVQGIYYDYLAKLPQSRLWGPGTWFEIHLGLPILENYLAKPGSEAFKTILQAWGSGLRLTEDDMQKARIRVKKRVDEEGIDPVTNPNVTNMADRRARLLTKQQTDRGLVPPATES